MADLLTHVLITYILLTIVAWVLPVIERRYIVLSMVGAGIPDLVKIGYFIDSERVETILGIPFSFGVFSTLGATILIAGIVTMFFRRPRRTIYAYILIGAFSGLLVDGLRSFADGRADFWLFPLWWRPPTPSLYITSDFRVLAATLFVSAAVCLIDRQKFAETKDG